MCESHVVVCEKLASTPEEIENIIRRIAEAGADIQRERVAQNAGETLLAASGGIYEQ